MRVSFILILFISSFVVHARMYQWVEPGVETTQLSGKPPAWYRSGADGPRTFVFEKGRLIDDTGIEVSEKVRQRLRKEAYLIVEKDKQKVEEKLAKAEQLNKDLKDEASREESEQRTDSESSTDTNLELLTDALFPKEETEDQPQIERDFDELRKIIADWETAQSDNARKSLQ